MVKGRTTTWGAVLKGPTLGRWRTTDSRVFILLCALKATPIRPFTSHPETAPAKSIAAMHLAKEKNCPGLIHLAWLISSLDTSLRHFLWLVSAFLATSRTFFLAFLSPKVKWSALGLILRTSSLPTSPVSWFPIPLYVIYVQIPMSCPHLYLSIQTGLSKYPLQSLSNRRHN